MSKYEEWDYGPFKVGDVVEVFNCQNNNGVQVEIIGALGFYFGKHDGDIYSYKVFFERQNIECLARPHEVRRRKPPMTGLQDVLAMFDKQPDRVKELA